MRKQPSLGLFLPAAAAFSSVNVKFTSAILSG